MARDFPLVQRAAEGGLRSCIVVRCSRCPTEAELSSHWRGRRGESIEIHLRRAGWHIGRRPGKDLCPDCARRQRGPHQEVVDASAPSEGGSCWANMTSAEKDDAVRAALLAGQPAWKLAARLDAQSSTVRKYAHRRFAVEYWGEGDVVFKSGVQGHDNPSVRSQDVVPAAVSSPADPPPTPDRDSRRLIHGEIEKYWLDERKGYANGETDLTIARRLGVPAAWVAEVREFAFGPEMTNEDLAAFVSDLKSLAADVASLREETSRQDGQLRALVERQDSLTRRAEPLLKAVRP